MGTNFRDYLNEQLRDPAFKAEYDALEHEFRHRRARGRRVEANGT